MVLTEIDSRARRQILKVNGNDVVGARHLMNQLRTETKEYADKLFGSVDALNNSLNQPTFRREGVISAIIRRVDSTLLRLVWIMASVAERLNAAMRGWQWRINAMSTILECQGMLQHPSLNEPLSGWVWH